MWKSPFFWLVVAVLALLAFVLLRARPRQTSTGSPYRSTAAPQPPAFAQNLNAITSFAKVGESIFSDLSD